MALSNTVSNTPANWARVCQHSGASPSGPRQADRRWSFCHCYLLLNVFNTHTPILALVPKHLVLLPCSIHPVYQYCGSHSGCYCPVTAAHPSWRAQAALYGAPRFVMNIKHAVLPNVCSSSTTDRKDWAVNLSIHGYKIGKIASAQKQLVFKLLIVLDIYETFCHAVFSLFRLFPHRQNGRFVMK